MVATQVPEPLCMHVQNWENFCGGDNSGARTTEPTSLVNEKGKKREQSSVLCWKHTVCVSWERWLLWVCSKYGVSKCYHKLVLLIQCQTKVQVGWSYLELSGAIKIRWMLWALCTIRSHGTE